MLCFFCAIDGVTSQSTPPISINSDCRKVRPDSTTGTELGESQLSSNWQFTKFTNSIVRLTPLLTRGIGVEISPNLWVSAGEKQRHVKLEHKKEAGSG
jgi:hypothetical protein